MLDKKLVIAFLVIAAVAACKKDGDKAGGGGGSGGGGGEKMDDAEQFFLKSVQEDLAAVKDALAKGEDPGFKCVAAASYGEKLKGKKNPAAEAVVKELTQVCGFDAPLAKLEGATKKAEEARKAKPDENPLSECYSAEQSTALEELKKAGHENDDKVKALVARWAAACPAK
jgi:hypothetical protein